MIKRIQSKRRWWGLSLGALLLIVLGLMVNQHSRYVDARLRAVQDYQDAFHGAALHVLTFVRVADGVSLLEPLRGLADAARDTEGRLIYAGQVIHMGLKSEQISATYGPSLAWQAIVLQQFASLDAYQTYLDRPAVATALAEFETTYTHGFERSASLNILLHQLLLGLRTWRTLTFEPDVLPFESAAGGRSSPLAEPLLQHADGLGRDAILIVNLAKSGSPEEQAANADYSAAMLGLMADLRYGPMHVGTTVSLEHDHQFDQAMLVYYPGSQYFYDLSHSTFFQGIIGDKQLADTQACITVPITNLLLNSG